MTNSPPLLSTGRRQRMRDLRSGDTPGTPAEADLSVLTSGKAPNEHSFLASLGQAIAAAAATGQRVLVFRARGCAVGLHKWSEPKAPRVEDLDRAIDERLLATDPTIVILRLAGDVIGFASEPQDPEDAEQLGGALAAGLAAVIGDDSPMFALTPRLGVAIVDGPRPGAARLAKAVADAVESVERTIDQTSPDTPYLVHTDYIHQRSHRQDEIGAVLDQALAERQITLEFQPRVALSDRSPVGLEVFPRWNHPELGQVPNLDFLRVAERSGRLGTIGRQVRADAMDMASRWAVDGSLGDRRLWFDVAPVELLDDGFAAEAAAWLEASPEIPVGLEMTDGPLLDAGVFDAVFDLIEELDILMALDNVRPSTLSFGRMQRLPIGQLNLDRELVRAVTTGQAQRDLIRAICSYARDRGIVVTACQVETDDELSALAELGVDQVQGYAVSKPLAEADLWPSLDRHGP